MPRKQLFTLLYDPEIAKHLDSLETKYHSLIRSTIEKQLKFEAETPTRNRKPLPRPVQ